MNPLIQFKPTTLSFLIVSALMCFALSPVAHAVSPAPDGGYPGFNTAEGQDALFSLTTGTQNSAIGAFSLFSNTDGSSNTAVGAGALALNTDGKNNTALGDGALFFNSTGGFNTATGVGALQNNTTAFSNTATGFQALFHNATGDENTATGLQALVSNNTGDDNTATGFQALFSNTTGFDNTAVGSQALLRNTIGNHNTATGNGALSSNTEGVDNTAYGDSALSRNTTGFLNVATGVAALFSNTEGQGNTASGINALNLNTTGSSNTAVGFQALLRNTIGNHNIALGDNAGLNLNTGDNNIDIGNGGVAAEHDTIRIGTMQSATFIAGISGANVAGGDQVFITSAGKLGTVNPPSSARFKEEIKPMNQASEVILALKPVTFRYKKEFDAARIPQFGLVAEEVEKVNPDLVKRDREGKVQTVRYDAVNAMLLNEFLKEHRTVQDLKSAAVKQKAMIARQQKQIDALTRGLQKVNDQLELRKPAPQTVLNDQ